MGLGARRDLLPSRCAWLQSCSSLTAGAGVQQSSSSWWDRAKAKPLWHPHQNGCPDAGQPRAAVPGAQLCADRDQELPRLWALHHLGHCGWGGHRLSRIKQCKTSPHRV